MIKHAKDNKQKSGFTLIELIVYISILLIIIIAVFSFLFWTIKASQRVNATRAVLLSVQHAFNALNREISTAYDIYTPTSSSTQVSLITSYNLPAGEDLAYVDFFQCGSNLCKKLEGENPEALLADSVSLQKLDFFYTSTSSTPSVIIHLKASYLSNNTAIYSESTIEATTTIALRAY